MRSGIFRLLKKEHVSLTGLLRQMEEQRDHDAREASFARLEEELRLHMKGEELFFYPFLGRHVRVRGAVCRSQEEHRLAAMVLSDLEGTPGDSERWIPIIGVLRGVVERHVKEEERELFRQAQEILSDEQQHEIYLRYSELKQKIPVLS